MTRKPEVGRIWCAPGAGGLRPAPTRLSRATASRTESSNLGCMERCSTARAARAAAHEARVDRGCGLTASFGIVARMVKILERGETMGDVPTRRTAVGKRYGKRYASNVGPCNVVLLLSRNALPWIVRSARNMIGFKQIEFFDHTGILSVSLLNVNKPVSTVIMAAQDPKTKALTGNSPQA